MQFVASGDYLAIDLPQDSGVKFQFTIASPSCPLLWSLTANSCNFLSDYSAKIVLGANAQFVRAIEGSISNFANPLSVRDVNNIHFTLYAKDGSIKGSLLTAFLTGFVPVKVGVTLASSSPIVGATSQTLTVSIKPNSTFAATGAVLINFPSYYAGATNDQMISKTFASCSGVGLTVDSCTYSTQTRQLSLFYHSNTGAASSVEQKIFVQDFKNPVRPEPKGGFFVTTADSQGFKIGESGEVVLSGITQATKFNFVTFQLNDTARIGEYTNLQMNIAMSLPLEPLCYVKIVFPADFTLDTQLFQLKGTSFFVQTNGQNIFSWLSIDYATRTVVVKGCEYTYGAGLTGSLTFSKVLNPNFIHDTGSFKVFLAVDQAFTQMIAQQTDQMFVPSQIFSPGLITSVQITPGDSLVYAETNYTFSFTPNNDLTSSTENKVVITLPKLLTFKDNVCRVSFFSAAFASSVTCEVNGSQAVLRNAFTTLKKGTPLTVTLITIVNPISVKDVGPFTLQTFMRVGSTDYKVDETTVSQVISTRKGRIQKNAEIYSSSYQTYDHDTTYIFDVLFQHTIPAGGSFRVFLPSEMFVFSTQKLQSYCYRLDYSPLPVAMRCQATASYFDVFIDKTAFGSAGLTALQQFKLQVVALNNPREKGRQVAFKFQSFDAEKFLIDESPPTENLVITMDETGQMVGLAVGITNKTNGAITDYQLLITPNTPIYSGDMLDLTFPPEAILPSSYVECRADPDRIKAVNCMKSGIQSLRIFFSDVKNLAATDTFQIWVKDVRNPVSLQPSSPFQNILLTSAAGLQISELSKITVTVRTLDVSYIQTKKLIQTTRIPLADATYTIVFTTNNELPPTTSILVKVPPGVSLSRKSSACYVVTKKRQSDLCRFYDEKVIRIPYAFADQGQELYIGQVEIYFDATNPDDTGSTSDSIQVTLYADAQFQYPIDMITDGLRPTFTCDYPCVTCELSNPSACTSCPQGFKEPSYMQPDKQSGQYTCKTACDKGYTFNNQNGLMCFPCAAECATCRTGGVSLVSDAESCTSCDSKSPFFWEDKTKCYKDACPIRSYRYANTRCRTCPEPCMECTNATDCIQCNPFSAMPLVSFGKCVSQCLTGFTPSFDKGFGECIPCKDPCATCSPGEPRNCTSCSLGDKQFLFGSQCVFECPPGTSVDLVNRLCDGCLQGCDVCNVFDRAECLVCADGFALLNKACLSECPPDFARSIDGATCEPRIYPLDQKFVPFPFLITCVLFLCIDVVSWRMTQKKTLITQSWLAQVAFIYVLLLLFKMIRAITEGRNLFTWCTIVAIALNFLLNCAFMITFALQVDDYQFDEYRKTHGVAYTIVAIISFAFTLHFFRVLFCKMFNLQALWAAATQPDEFYRPLRLYSILQMCFILLPMISLDIYGAVETWIAVMSNQLQMAMIEGAVMGIVLVVLILRERFYQRPRNLVFRPSEQSPFFIGLFSDKNIPDLEAAGGEGGASIGFWTLAEKANRHIKLKEVIRRVKESKDLKLNNELDVIMDLEINAMRARGYESERNPHHRKLWDDLKTEKLGRFANVQDTLSHGHQRGTSKLVLYDAQEDDQEIKFNRSFPGAICNPDYDNDDKRMELMNFFQQQAELTSLVEAQIKKGLQNMARRRTKSINYDNMDFDNVYADHREKVGRETQTLEVGGNFLSSPRLGVNRKKMSLGTGSDQFAENFGRSKKRQARHGGGQGLQSLVLDIPDHLYTMQQKYRDDRFSFKPLYHGGQREGMDGALSSQPYKSQLRVDLGAAKSLISVLDFEKEAVYVSYDSEESIVAVEIQSDETFKMEGRKPYGRKEVDKMGVLGSEGWVHKYKLMRTLIVDGHNPYHKADNNHVLEDNCLHVNSPSTQKTEEIEVEDGRDRTVFRHVPAIKRRQPANQVPHNIEQETISNDMGTMLFYNVPQQISDSSQHDSDSELGDISMLSITSKKEILKRWSDEIHQRNFNVFDVLGHFELDQFGRIKDREQVIYARNFRDLDGQLVNERGYLINEQSGVIRCKFTFDDMLKPETACFEDYGELPMPYRLEKFNFNPHKILGNFDFDPKTQKPIFLKNKFGIFTDKNFRPVNEYGFLINEFEDILNNEGHIRFPKSVLTQRGNLPLLYNYLGEKFSIFDIIGQFKKHDQSKQIILRSDLVPGRATDDLGRPVNSNGYLVDEHSNIINGRTGATVFRFWEVLYQEPPKIFPFSEWSLSWILGRTDPSNENLRHDEYDLDGRLINVMGYLVDDQDNIVDRYGREVLKKMLLSCKFGQDSEIPLVFRTPGLLLQPETQEYFDFKTKIEQVHARSGVKVKASPQKVGKDSDYQNDTNTFSRSNPDAETAIRSDAQTTKYCMGNFTTDAEAEAARGSSIISGISNDNYRSGREGGLHRRPSNHLTEAEKAQSALSHQPTRINEENTDQGNLLNIHIGNRKLLKLPDEITPVVENGRKRNYASSGRKNDSSTNRKKMRPKTTKGDREFAEDLSRRNRPPTHVAMPSQRPGDRVISQYQAYLETDNRPFQEERDVSKLLLDSTVFRGKSFEGRPGHVVSDSSDKELKVHPLTTKNVQSKSVGRSFRFRNNSQIRTQFQSTQPGGKHLRHVYGSGSGRTGLLSPQLQATALSALGFMSDGSLESAQNQVPNDRNQRQLKEDSTANNLKQTHVSYGGSRPSIKVNAFMGNSVGNHTSRQFDDEHSYASKAEQIFSGRNHQPLLKMSSELLKRDVSNERGYKKEALAPLKGIDIFKGSIPSKPQLERQTFDKQIKSVSNIYQQALSRKRR